MEIKRNKKFILVKEQKQVFNSPKTDENHATIMKKMPKIMNHAKNFKKYEKS